MNLLWENCRDQVPYRELDWCMHPFHYCHLHFLGRPSHRPLSLPLFLTGSLTGLAKIQIFCGKHLLGTTSTWWGCPEFCWEVFLVCTRLLLNILFWWISDNFFFRALTIRILSQNDVGNCLLNFAILSCCILVLTGHERQIASQQGFWIFTCRYWTRVWSKSVPNPTHFIAFACLVWEPVSCFFSQVFY